MTAISASVLQGLLVAALVTQTPAAEWKTMAQANVYDPRTWPTTLGAMPIILVDTPKETKRGMGRSGGPQFTCVATVRVVGRVTAKASAGDDNAAGACLAAAQLLERQIEVAVVNDYDLKLVVQQFASVEVETAVRRDGEVLFGETVMLFGLEYFQGPEDFAPNPFSDLEEIALYADLVNVFSSSGDFTGDPHATPFVDQAADPPRTQGPDGRAEGAVIVTLPQP